MLRPNKVIFVCKCSFVLISSICMFIISDFCWLQHHTMAVIWALALTLFSVSLLLSEMIFTVWNLIKFVRLLRRQDMRVRGGGEPPKPASSRDNDSLQHSLNTQCSGSPRYISQQDQENYLEWVCLYVQNIFNIKGQIFTIINSTDFQLILMTIKRNVGDRNHSRISYSALDKCDPRLPGWSEVMGPNCSQSHSQMLSNFQSD